MSNRRKLRVPGRYETQPHFRAAPVPAAFLAAGNQRASGLLRLRESATLTPERVVLTETHTSLAESGDPTGATQLVQLIDAGWGSSGYYSPQVLEAAAQTKVFPRGLHLYINHPSATEEHDRPERSVRDIAAVLAEDSHYDPTRKALVARVQVFPHCQELLTSLAQHIGLSIRADGTAEMGEAEGRAGWLVTALTEALSVDYVTKAGRGGKVLALLESARNRPLAEARNVGAWLESRLHLELTRIADDMYGDGRLTRDERITLSGAIGDGLQAWTARVEADAPQLFQRDLHVEPEPDEQPVAVLETSTQPEPPPDPGPAVSGTPTVAEAATTQPSEEPGMSGTETSTPVVRAEAAPQAEPATLSHEARAQIAGSQLREAHARITALESQNAALTVERDTVRGEVRRIRNVEAARGAVTAALAAVQDLPQPARTRISEALTATPPTTEAGEVDTVALNAAVGRQVEAERAYIASIRESAGEGTPTGLGSTHAPPDAAAWQADIAKRFGRIGLDESAAAAAARR